MTTITPKNWDTFQHYKDRSPPWIKLHKGLLDDFDYQCLPVASRALAPMLWLLASEHPDGEIDADPKKLAFRLRMAEREVNDALKPLIDKGFFKLNRIDSTTLAERKRDACLETETETETEGEDSGEPQRDSPPAFTIPLISGAEFPISDERVGELVQAYPAVDVRQQLREMRQWCIAKPAQRKTERGVNAFIVRWLGREQDKGGGSPLGRQQARSDWATAAGFANNFEAANAGCRESNAHLFRGGKRIEVAA